MTTPPRDRPLRVPAHVASTQVGGEVIVVDLANGEYYGLDPVGSSIWQMVERGCRLADVAADMAARYGIPLAQAEADARFLLDELRAQGLLE